jgi:hypothetical protein
VQIILAWLANLNVVRLYKLLGVFLVLGGMNDSVRKSPDDFGSKSFMRVASRSGLRLRLEFLQKISAG